MRNNRGSEADIVTLDEFERRMRHGGGGDGQSDFISELFEKWAKDLINERIAALRCAFDAVSSPQETLAIDREVSRLEGAFEGVQKSTRDAVDAVVKYGSGLKFCAARTHQIVFS